MAIAEFIGTLILPLLQSAAYDMLKSKVTDLEQAIHKATTKACEDFYSQFGDEFGNHTNSFLAKQDNWDVILKSLFYSSDNVTVEKIDPEGFGVKPATPQAIEFFILSLNKRIRENHTLDRLFAEKKHFAEQTEGMERQNNTLLKIQETSEKFEIKMDKMQVMLQELVGKNFHASDEHQKNAVQEVIDEQINGCIDLINDNKPSAAISILENLKAKHWGELSVRLQFRIATNIAAAKLRIGDDNVSAAQELLQAALLTPEDKKAICNNVIAHFLLGNFPAALKTAKEAVSRYPNDAECFQVLVLASVSDEECTDPSIAIPVELLSCPELALQLGDFFQRRNNPSESKKWFRKAFVLNPSSPEIQEAYATSLLDYVLIKSPVVYGNQITMEHHKQLEEARDLLAGIWANAKGTEISGRYIPCAINLSNAARLLGHRTEALACIEDALHLHPGNFLLMKQKCICLLSDGRIKEACALLRHMPDDAFEGKVLMEAEALALVNEPREAMLKIACFFSDTALHDPNNVVVANAMKVQLTEKLEGVDAGIGAALELAAKHPETIEYLLLVSEMFEEKEDSEKALEWVEKARQTSACSGNFLERTRVADRYFSLGDYRVAATLYAELITSYDDSRNLRRLFASYMAGDIRGDALDLVSRLPQHVKQLHFYGRACAELYYRLGDLPAARKYLEGCLKSSPENLELQLNYITLLERMGLKEEAQKALKNLPAFSDPAPEDSIRLAHALARHGMNKEALSIGYSTLRRFNSIANVHLGYCGLLLGLNNIPEMDQVTERGTVDINTAFTCLTESGKSLTYVIEPDSADESRGEISPDHSYSKRAIGLSKNQKFVIFETPFGQEEATITEIKHKYIHALHESMHNFQYRFPGVPGMWMFTLKSSAEGNLELQPVLDAVSRRSETVMRTLKLYEENPIPLALVAHQIGVHPIDSFLGMSSAGRVKIKCCNGDSVERDNAVRAVLSSKAGFIIDPFALYTLYILNLLDNVVSIAGGKIGITQSTLDLFIQLMEERKAMGSHMSLAKEGEHFVRTEISHEDIQLSIRPFESILAWCTENCEILPAAGKPGSKGDELHLFSGLHPSFLDTLLAAEGSGRLLISEDLHYRQVANLLFNVEGVWSQPLLQSGRLLRCVTDSKYHEAVLQLIKMNYRFISISHDDLMYHLVTHKFEVTEDFNKLLSTISDRSTDIASSLSMIVNFFCLLFQSTRSYSALEKTTYTTLHHLTTHPSHPAGEILCTVCILLIRRKLFGKIISDNSLKLVMTFVQKWAFGHFIPLNRQ